MDPVRDQSTPSHRQQRLGGTGQVSEPPAAVSQHVPLEPGPVTGGENYSLHLKSGPTRRSLVSFVSTVSFVNG